MSEYISSAPMVVQAVSTTSFQNSIGVNTKLTWLDMPYLTDAAAILSDLNYVGIHTVRDGANANFAADETLMAAGIKFDLGGDVPVATMIANFDQLEAANPGGIIAAEGINETVLPELAATLAHQQTLFAAVAADPLLRGVAVYNYTTYSFEAQAFTQAGSVAASSTDGNTHSYSASLPPEIWNAWFVPRGLAGTPGLPAVVTETGYNTAAVPIGSAQSEGVDQDVQAKYTLDTVFDMFHDGVQQTYLYELMDSGEDPTDTINEDAFGLFNADGTPKQAAVALHNLAAILGGGAGSAVPGTLAYSIAGIDSTIDPAALAADFGYGILINSYVETLPVYGNSLLMEKADGTFDLAVWREPEIWDAVTSSEISVAAAPVTVTLGQVAASVEIFDPLAGSAPIARYTDVDQVVVDVSASPIIIEIDAAASTSGQMGGAAAVPVSAGEPLNAAPDDPSQGVFGGRSGQYDYGASGTNTLVLQDMDLTADRPNDGTQMLSEGQVVHFSDATGIADPAGSIGALARLYQAAFDRTPDLAGLQFWAQAQAGGASLGTIAAGFTTSSEFVSDYGQDFDSQFIAQLYQNVLGRAGDASGETFWAGVLDQGLGRGYVLMQFAASAEDEANTVALSGSADQAEVSRLYQAAFNRAPDSGGLAAWTNHYDQGQSPVTIAAEMASAPEYQSELGGLSNQAFIAQLYQNVLGRAADAGGDAFWVGAMNGGESRASVLVGFSDSLENRLGTSALTRDGLVLLPA